MPDLIAIKIDVKKILKDRLFNAQSGAVYLDAILIPSKDSKYGDSHMIVQSISKEERESGKKGPIIGNAKTLERKGGSSPDATTMAKSKPAATNIDENVPF